MAEPPLGTLTMSNGQGLRRLVRPAGATKAPRAVGIVSRRAEASMRALPFNGAANSMTLPGWTTFVPK